MGVDGRLRVGSAVTTPSGSRSAQTSGSTDPGAHELGVSVYSGAGGLLSGEAIGDEHTMTSVTDPIFVDFVPRDEIVLSGLLGKTSFAPGMKALGQRGRWDRDLAADLREYPVRLRSTSSSRWSN